LEILSPGLSLPVLPALKDRRRQENQVTDYARYQTVKFDAKRKYESGESGRGRKREEMKGKDSSAAEDQRLKYSIYGSIYPSRPPGAAITHCAGPLSFPHFQQILKLARLIWTLAAARTPTCPPHLTLATPRLDPPTADGPGTFPTSGAASKPALRLETSKRQ